jgi:hypothetical protein
VAFTFADLNSDGSPDLLYFDSNRYWFQAGRGNGTFLDAEEMIFPSALGEPVAIRAVDINNDGRTDLVISSPFTVNMLVQTAPRVFVLNSAVDFTPHTSTDLVLGDINGDGRVDVLTTDRYLHECNIVLSSGGVWTAGSRLGNCNPGFLGDVNNDGRADLLSMAPTPASNPYIFRYVWPSPAEALDP